LKEEPTVPLLSKRKRKRQQNCKNFLIFWKKIIKPFSTKHSKKKIISLDFLFLIYTLKLLININEINWQIFAFLRFIVTELSTLVCGNVVTVEKSFSAD